MRPDILVRDSSGEPVLAVEVKARRGVDQAWAAELRRNLRAHGASLPGRFFMIVTAEQAYLWRESDRPSTASELPEAVAATPDLMAGVAGAERVDGHALEFLVSSWLAGVAASESPEQLSGPSRTFLVETGLYDELRGATVAFEVV